MVDTTVDGLVIQITLPWLCELRFLVVFEITELPLVAVLEGERYIRVKLRTEMMHGRPNSPHNLCPL